MDTRTGLIWSKTLNLLRLGIPLAFFVIVGCSDGSDNKSSQVEVELEPESPQLELSYTEAPIDLPNIVADYSADVSYGDGERNLFDIFLPDSDEPTPLVIYYHGGGYFTGDKSDAYEYHPDDIRAFLAEGVAYATVSYHLLSLEPPLDEDGVIHSLEDGARALQFIRYYADSLNIDPEQIAVYGVSAGASTSLWLGTHDDLADPDNEDPVLQESSRVNAMAALHTQSTLNAIRWEEALEDTIAPFAALLGGTDIPTIVEALDSTNFLFTILGVSSVEEIYEAENTAYRDNIDIFTLMDSGDAPLYAYNISPSPEDLVNLFLHHAEHAQALHEWAETAGLESVVYAYDPAFTLEHPSGEDHVSFLLGHIK
jgi:DNA-binding transcriptional ArsR family regulator